MKRYAGILSAVLCGVMVATSVCAEGDAEGDGRRGRGPREGRGRHRFQEMDTNQDQQITFEEFKAFHEKRMKEMFEKRDANGDGVLSQEDFQKMRERRKAEGGPRRRHGRRQEAEGEEI
jgi:hypothetical protein